MTIVVNLVSVLLLSACSSASEDQPATGRSVHSEGDGPLAANNLGGGSSIFAPKAKPWSATFGWAYPCSTTGESIVIDDVRYEVKVKPMKIDTVAFRVADKNETIGSLTGTPESLLRSKEIRGKILGSVESLKITAPCDQSGQEAMADIQLLTVVEAGVRGAELGNYLIDYTAGEQTYTLKVDWQVVACGSATPSDMCQP